jgi:nucleoside-diphosphate-sugar epimerase
MGAALEAWHEMIVTDSPKTKETLADSQGWVDVRDTALGHVLALEKDSAGGERIFTVGGTHCVILIYPIILTLI